MARSLHTVGGGPAGSFLARLVARRGADWSVTVHERNQAAATFGFGIVFSDRTLGAFADADPEMCDAIVGTGVRVEHMEIRHQGRRVRWSGFAFTAVSRHRLLSLLQEGAAAAGAELHFEEEVDLDAVHGADVVAVADGANSGVRAKWGDRFGADEDFGLAKFIWLGATVHLDAMTFAFAEDEHGTWAVHAYPYAEGLATFLVETDEVTWRRAGLDTEAVTKAYLEHLFADVLGGGELLMSNSRWQNFRVVHNDRWHSENVVLLGDAAHTAHPSVGSGTKMAMEDAIALDTALAVHGDDVTRAFVDYERERRPFVERVQGLAAPSQRWWETFGSRLGAAPEQLAAHYISRTGLYSLGRLAQRSPELPETVRQWFRASVGITDDRHVLRCPGTIDSLPVRSRLVATDVDGPLDDVGIVLLPAADVSQAAVTAWHEQGVVVGAVVPLARFERACGRAAGAGVDYVVVDVPLTEEGAETTVAASDCLRPAELRLGIRLVPAPDEDEEAADTVVGALAALGPLVSIVHAPSLALADRIRWEAGIPTVAPGDGLDLDRAETLVAAGRADFVADLPAPFREETHDGMIQ